MIAGSAHMKIAKNTKLNMVSSKNFICFLFLYPKESGRGFVNCDRFFPVSCWTIIWKDKGLFLFMVTRNHPAARNPFCGTMCDRNAVGRL